MTDTNTNTNTNTNAELKIPGLPGAYTVWTTDPTIAGGLVEGMGDVIKKLGRKRPGWRFRVEDRHGIYGRRVILESARGEELGSVDWDGTDFVLKSPRLSRDMHARKRYRESQHAASIVREACKWCSPQTATERVERAGDRVSGVMSYMRSACESALADWKYKVYALATGEAGEGVTWEEYTKQAVELAARRAAVDGWSKRHIILTSWHDEAVLARFGSEVVQLRAMSDLPTSITPALAILKMQPSMEGPLYTVKADDYTLGVGIRADEDVFAVAVDDPQAVWAEIYAKGSLTLSS